MATALALRGHGVDVDLIDADPNWRVYGAGITVTGISLRAFDALGILDDIRERGYVSAGLRGKNVAGEIQFELPVAENPLPIESTGGIMRPALHEILSKRVRAAGVNVHLGVRADGIEQDLEGVDVTFSDGRVGRYDLLVGADGIYSTTRELVFPDAPKPKFTGQGCWRVVAARPEMVDRSEMYFGGPVKVGLVPISRDEMYMFVLEHVPDNPFYAVADQVPHLKTLLAPFGGPAATVRETLNKSSLINYRPLEWVLLPDPWFAGRIVIIGDAAHATTPHMASGAGIAVEDGLVLADELSRTDDEPAALAAFMKRRFERARMVVENSLRIGEVQMAGGNELAGSKMLGATMHQLRDPY
jgi:2-polyprenyl-6-methoxyphenol hydroxylase-like FAD-dependent oxidoreductase